MSYSKAARVAVLSDIHAVLPALRAVLAEPDVENADRIVLPGDILAGPQPVETLELLRSLGDRAVWVRGNADRELGQWTREEPVETVDSMAEWAATQLALEDVTMLDGLPLTVTLDIEDVGPTLFCHATPRDDEEVVVVDSRLERWAEVYQDVDPSITTVVCGHTHMPYVRLAHGRMVVNPGSVGMPYGRPGAHWALLGKGVGVSLRRTMFDLEAAVEEIATTCPFEFAGDRWGLTDARAWAENYVLAKPTDADALAVMGPRDGR